MHLLQTVLKASQLLKFGLLPMLLTIPPKIRVIQDQVFYIREKILWTTKQFHEYWGYITVHIYEWFLGIKLYLIYKRL